MIWDEGGTVITFMDLLKEGKVDWEDIDDFIDQWHQLYNEDSLNVDLPLYEFLGMTQKEYAMWLEDGA